MVKKNNFQICMLSPLQVVPFIKKKFVQKYFLNWIIFRDGPRHSNFLHRRICSILSKNSVKHLFAYITCIQMFIILNIIMSQGHKTATKSKFKIIVHTLPNSCILQRETMLAWH